MHKPFLAAAGLAAVGLLAAACGSPSKPGSPSPSSAPAAGASSASAGAASSGTALQTRAIGGKTLLTNANGLTLYLFVPDTATMSKCNAGCVHYWPPVKGPAMAGPGVTGKLSTIKRSDGSIQATYNGHPLYTYVGDTGPGQAKGNGLNVSGGLWYDTPVSVRTMLPPTSSPSSQSTSAGSSGGGY
jgi:predicted lipoprotein with Yx(FWY)xxD motif